MYVTTIYSIFQTVMISQALKVRKEKNRIYKNIIKFNY